MLESNDEILKDLDETLDRLLENAHVLEEIGDNPLFSTEKEALTKTQESLIAHMFNVENLLEGGKPRRKVERRAIDAKLRTFKKRPSPGKINPALVSSVAR